MAVRRIVANIAAADPSEGAPFYEEALGLSRLMDMGWIATWGTPGGREAQVTAAREGGSGTSLPGLSIEVDDLDEVLRRVTALGFAVEYGPVDEPWGVRRFFTRDPFGTLVNVLQHLDQPAASPHEGRSSPREP